MIAILDSVGNALILQVCFLLCSLPLVTVVWSAMALQRSLEDLRAGERTGLRLFVRHLVEVCRQYRRLGLGASLIGASLIVSLSFWLSVDSVAGAVALGLLVFWAGLGAATYLSLLDTSSRRRDFDERTVLAMSFDAVRSQPLRATARVVMLGSWLLVLGSVPTLTLVGCGLVPAVIASYAVGGHDQEPGGITAGW